MATTSIQNTVVRAPRLVSSISHLVFLKEIDVLAVEVPPENTCSRRIFYSELTDLATISIQNTVVCARRCLPAVFSCGHDMYVLSEAHRSAAIFY